ncbi:MAG: hypothetical protein ICV63_10295 [Coleofasciculus sp. Co-bin14]|nr:hypothetical protein [Coleofasciculus sp. Co-bin14]
MKRLILGSLSVLLLASLSAPALQAQSPSDNPSSYPAADPPISNDKLTPFTLVRLAYQGFLKDQGIPSGEGLLDAYQNRDISAKKLIESAIQAKRLPAEALNDSDYLVDVDSQLSALNTGLRGGRTQWRINTP